MIPLKQENVKGPFRNETNNLEVSFLLKLLAFIWPKRKETEKELGKITEKFSIF